MNKDYPEKDTESVSRIVQRVILLSINAQIKYSMIPNAPVTIKHANANGVWNREDATSMR